MLKSKVLCSILLSFLSFSLLAQYNETIRTARPGQAFGPFTVGKGIFQMQTGANFNSFEEDNSNVSGNQFNYFNSMRYGIQELMELRLAFGYNNDKIETSDGDIETSGLSALIVGVRFTILDNAGTRKPSLSLQTSVALDAIGEDYAAENAAPAFVLIHTQSLNDWLGLTTNWGVSWNGNTGVPTGNYVINLSFPITDKLGSFIEAYGTFQKGDFDIRYDTGLGYLVNNDFLIDCGVGIGSNDGITDSFFDFGLSFRVGQHQE